MGPVKELDSPEEEQVRNRIKTVAVAAVVSALTVAGLAVAQSDDSGSGGGDGQNERGKRVMRFHGPPPGGPGGPGGAMLLGGPGGGKLTYSETHLRKDGKDVVVRTDKGKVTAAGDDSISIERNDGETVEVAVDGDTKVLAGPGKDDATVADIAAGKQVVVVREDGDEAAEAVMVEPSRKDRLKLRRHIGGPPPADGQLPAPPSFDGEQG